MNGEDLGIVYPTLSNGEKRTIAREVVRIQNVVSTIKLDNIEDSWRWNSFVQGMLERAKERLPVMLLAIGIQKSICRES